MNEGTLVPWLGFWAVKDQAPGGLRNGVRAARLRWLMCWEIRHHGVPSAICPQPPVVSNAKHVDRGGFLPDPGQLTSPVGRDDDRRTQWRTGRPPGHPVPGEPPGPRRAP